MIRRRPEGNRDVGPAGAPGTAPDAGTSPRHAPLVLLTLILVASVANLNLAVANVALPDIGKAFGASQTQLDLVAVGYSLGLAASVLYLGAIGDRYGRKLLLMIGMVMSVPAALLAAYAPSVQVLTAGRILGGLAAGMAYPTTLALITALWSGTGRTRSIALWSGIGGAMSALGSLLAGALLLQFAWGSVFLVTIPIAVAGLVLAIFLVPAHVNETAEPVDNIGGVVSIFFVAALVLCINFAPEPGMSALALVLAGIATAGGVVFFLRQRTARNPLYDLKVAGRRPFWVAAVAGIIVFGTLMGALFVGQQFIQNVLGYSTMEAGAAILPAAALLVLTAPVSARLIGRYGSRVTLLAGYFFCLLSFIVMLALWKEGIGYWPVGLAFAFIGIGVGLAGTPAARALTGSVPVRRVGMASGTADLQRDLGGAIMQSILGAVLTAGYAAAFAASIAAAPDGEKISQSVQVQLQKSFAGAEAVAQQYPQYADQIVAAAQASFIQGADWAYSVGIVAIVLGAAVVLFLFPKKSDEVRLHAEYQTADAVGVQEAA